MVARYHYLSALNALYHVKVETTGSFKDADGNFFEGQLLNGIPYGKGKIIFKDSMVYEGDVVNGRPYGKGTRIDSTGTYTGDWVNNQHFGKGVVRYKDGDWYEGELKNKLYFGQGTYHKKNGSWAKGEFSNNAVYGKIHIHSVLQKRDFDTTMVNVKIYNK